MKLFDLHCDTLTECYLKQQLLSNNTLHWDFARAKALFESAFQVTAVYIPDTVNETDAWEYFLRICSFLQIQNIPTVHKAEDLQTFSHAVLPAVENGKLIGNDLSKLRMLADFGVVYVTLTWNRSNQLGNGCLSGSIEGLSSFGKAAVREMFRLGILPDVSHINKRGFWDVASIANGNPFLASHSISDAVFSHPRNISDDQFSEIVLHNGLVGLNMCDFQLGEQTFEQFERHLYHFLELGGENHLAFGLDLDGTSIKPEWGGVALVPVLFEYLIQKGYANHLLERVFFENAYTFFTKTLTSRKKCIKIDA